MATDWSPLDHDQRRDVAPAARSQAPSALALPPTQGDDLQDLTKYLGALRRGWPLIFAFCLVAAGFAFVRYWLTPKEYRTTATIQIERKRLSLIALGQAGWLEDWWNMEYYPTQYRLLRSRGMAERVIQTLRLHEDPSFTGRPASLLGGDPDAEITTAQDKTELAALAGKLMSGLGVFPIKDTQLVELTYTSQNPQLAARVANGYAQAFIEWGIQTRTETVRGASTFLADQITSLREEIEDLQRELNAYTVDSDIVLDPEGETLLARRKTLEEKYNRVVADRITREAAYRDLLNQGAETAANPLSGGAVGALRGEIEQLEAEYERKLETFEPTWPAMVELEGQIRDKKDRLRRLVRSTVEEARDQAYSDFQRARREEDVLEAELRTLAEEARKLNSSALEYQGRAANLQTRKDLLSDLLKRQSETDVASRIQTSQESNVRIVDEAIVPGSPFRPSLRNNLVQSLLLGFMLGAGTILLIEFFDRTVKKPEELEALTGLPTLAVIPDLDAPRGGGRTYKYGRSYGYGYGNEEPARRPLSSLLPGLGRGKNDGDDEEGDEINRIELLPHHRPRLAACETYRSLRTALLLSSAEEVRTVAVTSAEPSEGKTATTVNLAVVLAQLGRRVLVVDGDLRRPRIHTVFQASNRVGLVNCLTAHLDLDSAVQETEVPNLYTVTAGPIPPNPSELLASDRMRELLRAALESFDFVLIDTPPALPVADAVILGLLADGVVICARAGSLQRDDARACRERLNHGDLRIFGTVLNRYRAAHKRYDKKYSYYGVYSEAPPTRKSSAA